MARDEATLSQSPSRHDSDRQQRSMNRLQRYDQNVFSIADLQREGTKKLSKMVGEYYNEGAMDLLRCVTLPLV